MAHELNIKELREGLFLMDEGGEATGYLLIGSEKACVIDTMNGYNDLNKAVRKYTDKPVIVVNTHGHPDHIYGNAYFDNAHLDFKDLEMAKMFINDPEVLDYLAKEGLSMPAFEEIKPGDVIYLGGRSLVVYEIPGHTPGGILLLCPEERLLFTGDSINRHLWMQIEGCTSIEEYIEVLEGLMYLTEEADHILHGHAKDFDSIVLMPAMLEGLKEIVAGKNENDSPYDYFGGTAHAVYHPYKVKEGDKYTDSGICYEPKTVKRK